jgi:uncharacterized membrane protein
MTTSLHIPFRLIQFATVFVFLGRAWQHLFWDAPLRVLLWDEVWMKPLVENVFKHSWDDYITNAATEEKILAASYAIGLFYLCCAIIAAFIYQVPKWLAQLMKVGGFCLFLLACLYCKEKFFSLGQLLEYSCQIVSPLLLFYWVYPKVKAGTYRILAKVAIAFTFICHGLYAVNYYPRPGEFVDMVINTFSVSETTAVQFLMVAGILDFIAGVAIFLPYEISRAALGYCVCWGFATTFARYTSNLDFSYLSEGLHQWTWQVLVRLPHCMIPLAILIFEIKRSGLKIPKATQPASGRKPILFTET